jgi:hypothetical protein
MKKYFILLLFLGVVNMTYSQKNKEMNSDIDIRVLNVELLNEMLTRFAEENRVETQYYPNFFQIPKGMLIKKSNINPEWKYGDWILSKEEHRELITPKKGISINADDVLLSMSAISEGRTNEIRFLIWFTPNRKNYQIVDEMIVTGSYAPMPIEISLKNLKADYHEIAEGTEGEYYEIYIKEEKIEDKEFEPIVTFLLQNISDEFSQSILYELITGEIKLPNSLRKKIFKEGNDTMRLLICRCKDLDLELMEWCEGVEDEFR